MKILHIQNGMGPAGNAAYRLSCAMRREGIDSSVLTLYPCSNYDYVYFHPQEKTAIVRKVINTLTNRLLLRGKKSDSYFYRLLPKIGRDITTNPHVKDADVIYIHWVAGALSKNDFVQLANISKPIVFYMHDMWDFTGGCHHSFNCQQYRTGCKECPMFFKNIRTPQRQLKYLKQIYMRFTNIVFVSPSEWMACCARNSFAMNEQQVVTIPNVVDESIFKPTDKVQAKKLLGLPLNKKIITFGCQTGTQNKFKGWDYLKEAISLLTRDDIYILVYGSEENVEISKQVKYPIKFLGHISEESKLSQICNATDVFVSPSLAESFGLTFLENILCGTPVVGFNNTAIPEIVKTGETGYLANNRDSQDLAKGINYLLGSYLKPQMYYSSSVIIKQHLELINSLTI